MNVGATQTSIVLQVLNLELCFQLRFSEFVRSISIFLTPCQTKSPGGFPPTRKLSAPPPFLGTKAVHMPRSHSPGAHHPSCLGDQGLSKVPQPLARPRGIGLFRIRLAPEKWGCQRLVPTCSKAEAEGSNSAQNMFKEAMAKTSFTPVLMKF